MKDTSTIEVAVAATPAGKVLLTTLTASNSSVLVDTNVFTGNFTFYEIVFDNLSPANSSSYLRMQFYVNGQLAVDSNYNTENFGNDKSGNSCSTNVENSFHLYQDARSAPKAGTGIFGKMTLFNPRVSGTNKSYVAELYAPIANDGLGCQVMSGGAYLGNMYPVTGIQFFFNNGNISTGAIRIYGSI